MVDTRPPSQVFADTLRALMEARGLTQSSLARKTAGKVGQTTIGLYLDPSRRSPTAKGSAGSPTLEKIQQVSDALGVHWSELLATTQTTGVDVMTKDWPFGSFISRERWAALTPEEKQTIVAAAVQAMFDVVSAKAPSGKEPKLAQG